jgi:hypothetical protein
MGLPYVLDPMSARFWWRYGSSAFGTSSLAEALLCVTMNATRVGLGSMASVRAEKLVGGGTSAACLAL